VRIGDGEKKRRKELVEFHSINYMREELEMPLLKKGWVACVSGCGDEFFTFDKKGNRICETCKNKPKSRTFHDFDDAFAVVGV